MKKVLIVLLVAVIGSGCAGFGLEGKVGLYREDIRQQSSNTYDRPLKCLFVRCADEVKGS